MYILEELDKVHMNTNRKILAQGDRDGACFLYSIANAAFALTDKVVTQSKWVKGIRALPFEMSDYIAGRGTEKLDLKPHYLEGFCQDFLAVLGVNAKVSWHEGLKSTAELKNILTPRQVFLMVIDDDAHWVAMVDADDKDAVFIACSAEALNGDSPYLEESSPRFNRLYNKQLKFAELRAEKGYGILISLSHDA